MSLLKRFFEATSAGDVVWEYVKHIHLGYTVRWFARLIIVRTDDAGTGYKTAVL
jgi:hypothetical protein